MLITAVKNRLLRQVLGNEGWARRNGAIIGKDCRILSNIVGSEPWLVRIGNHVTISANVLLVTHDGSGWLYVDGRGRRFRYGPVEIGSDVFIGTNSILLPGVRIGDRCVVGAGSVVTKSVPSDAVVAGNPAKKISDWATYMSRLAQWSATADQKGASRREQIDSIVETRFRAELT